MKYFYFTFIYVAFSFSSFAQQLGGIPVSGTTTIGRTESEIAAPQFLKVIPPNSTTPTGTSTEVGITEGQLSVSLTGGANYNIPIAAPPGINGIIPEIGLSYSSQGGNGLAGYGWNLTGLSNISRIPSTKFHDGTIDGVDFNSLDRFALDGQRLVAKTGKNMPYGQAGAVYQTESFSNVKITSYGVHPNGANFGPEHFLVQYPDGSKAFYGYSNNSRSITNWAISYWENPQGVRISYDYTTSNNSLFINEVRYGSLLADPSINILKFVYKSRIRPEQAYVGGQSIVNDKILLEIKSIGKGKGFRNYYLQYSTMALGYEQLSNIVEKSGDNLKSYNPTVFNYEETSSIISYSSATASLPFENVSLENSATISGDFDGDGKMDFLMYPTTGNDAKRKYWIFSEISSSIGNLGIEHPVGIFEDIVPVTFLTESGILAPMQGWNVITKNNVTNITTFTSYSKDPILPHILYQYERSFSFPTLIYYNEHPLSCTQTRPPIKVERQLAKRYVSGDFNGDGLTDIIVVEQNYNYLRNGFCNDQGQLQLISETYIGQSYFINLDRRFTTSNLQNAGQLNINSEDKVIVGDFNGDGKSDIYIFSEGYLKVYTLNNQNQFIILFENTIGNSDIVLDKIILMGDYNGDGKSDFIIPKGFNSTNYAKFLSTGQSFVITNEYYNTMPYNQSVNNNIFHYIANDINNDGKTDIIAVKTFRGSNGSSQGGLISIRIHENMMSDFISEVFVDTFQANILAYPVPIFLSSDKLNKNLEISFISGSKIHNFQSKKDFNQDKLLSSVVTGNGVTESITYLPLDKNALQDGNAIYAHSGYTEIYPNTDILVAPTLQVVSKLEKQSNTVYKKQLFFYYGAVSNVEGLGFLGFRGLMRTNWHNDNSQITSSISKFDINMRGANIANYVVLDIGNLQSDYSFSDYISKSILSYESELLSNKVFKVKKHNSKQFNGLENTSSETTTVYDSYLNPTQSTTTLKNGNTLEQTTVTDVEYINANIGTTYFFGRPTSKTQTITAWNETVSNQELYSYENNLLTEVQKRGHNTSYITETNEYDNFGNIKKKTISALGITPRITSYEYDISGRFLEKSIDIEGLESQFAFNYNNGLLISETNPYGLNTTYLYDSWFKKTKTTDYLDKSSKYDYSRNSEKTIISITGADESFSEETYDDIGRKVKTSVKDINGNISSVNYLYDIYDRNVKKSEPYFGNQPSQWNESTYDIYGRLEQNKSFTEKITTISYDGLATTVNDGIKSKTTLKNAIGNVIAVTDDPGGTINYSYFANGNLKTTNYEGVVTSIAQDGWGRKIKLTDPSAGIYTYEYNLLGETLKETTPNGTTTYTLDAVGKLTKKIIVGTNTNSETIYNYNPATKLIVSTVFKNILEGNSIINYSYGYDSYKRLDRTTEITPFAKFVKQLTFDGFGRVNTENTSGTLSGKTSSKTVKNTYKNGFAWQIIDNTTQQVLWQTNATNARGQLLTAQLGNGIAISNTYDSFGFPSQFKHDRSGTSPANIMTLNTEFNPLTGNLTSRTNSLFAWNESFIYDSSDRLTSFKNAAGIIENQDYDARGRITKNATGIYQYGDPTKAYQNTGLLLMPDSVPYYEARPTQNISYNSFKSPVTIEEVGIDKVSFTYNDSNGRSTMFYSGLQDNKLQRTFRKHYSADGSVEIKENRITGNLEFITYIGGDGYSAPIVLKSNGTTQNYLYLHRDYQGSILAITNESGQIVEKRLFDAWGNIAKVEDADGNTLTVLTLLDRGYTGHEHLQSVGLVNMNGRLYDAKLHRFLQPDNFVQDPSNTQNFNRYGYCWNNPLKYSDPSGEWIWIVVAAVVGGIVNWATHGAQFNMEGIKAFGIGVVAGTIAATTGGAAFAAAGGAAAGVGGFTAGAVAGAFSSAASQMFLSIANNIAFGDPLMSLKQQILGIAMGAVLGGSINGISAIKNGKDFITGVDKTRIAVDPISTRSAGLTKTVNSEIKSDTKLPNTTKASTSPTTQNNTATSINKELGVVDVSKNPDFRIIQDGSESFFDNTRYTDKVIGQMKSGDFHSFPKSVEAFELNGTVSPLKGGDGIYRQILKIPGQYGNRSGFFEFIKEADGTINHRLFNIKP